MIATRRSDWPEWSCPVHRIPLEHHADVLVCPKQHSFPRRQGIPRFVAGPHYAGGFGAQWKKYKLTQLDSYTGTTITMDRARRSIGEKLWAKLSHQQILECGCGAGRFTEILIAKSAYVTSVDLSDAVEANQENFPQNRNHRIAQADILQLPFLPQQFDVVVCLGVIQHAPDPEKTIASLYEQVRPGGTLCIDHYTHDLSWYTKTAPLVRRFFRRLSPDEGIKWSERLVGMLFPLHKLARHFYPAQMVLSRLSPVVCYFNTYPHLSDQLHREWALLDTHDTLTAYYRHVRTRGQISETLERLGLEEIWCQYGGNGVEARGMRPSRLSSRA